MAEAQQVSTDHENKDPRKSILCPVCVDVLQDPVTLQCYHHICKICLENEATGEGPSNSIDCPVCHHASEQQYAQGNPLIIKMVEYHQSSKCVDNICGQCMKIKAGRLCRDCDVNLCDDCHNGHLRLTLLKNHRIVPIGDQSCQYIDHIVFCSKHDDKPVELHCLECEKLMCIKCKVDDHLTHSTESPEGALERLSPPIKEKLEYMQTVINCKQQAVEYIRKAIEDLQKDSKETKKKIEQQREKTLQYVEESFSSLINEVDRNEKEEITRLKQLKSNEENNIKYIDGITSWGETLDQLTTSITLLQEYQSGYRAKVNELEKQLKGSSPLKVNRECPNFKPGNKPQNILGEVSLERATPVHFDVRIQGPIPGEVIHKNPLSVPLTTLVEKKWKKSIEFPCKEIYRIGTLDNKFILPKGNTIYVYSQNGDIIKEFKHNQLNGIRCCVQYGTDIIVATYYGLFCISTDGIFQYKIADGRFTELTKRTDTVYALDFNSGKGCKVSKEGDMWRMVHLFSFYKGYADSTIIVTAEHIVFCRQYNGLVYKYSKQGNLASQFGEEKNGIHSFLNTTDLENNILVCQRSNSTIQVLKSDGQWVALNVPNVNHPRDVIVEDENTLWCLCNDGTEMVKYVSQKV